MRITPHLPDFSVVAWLRETDKFSALKSELLAAAEAEPYESTHYQGMVDFHWAAASLADAKRLAQALTSTARQPELVLLQIMSRIDGVGSLCIKDERRTKHLRHPCTFIRRICRRRWAHELRSQISRSLSAQPGTLTGFSRRQARGPSRRATNKVRARHQS